MRKILEQISCAYLTHATPGHVTPNFERQRRRSERAALVRRYQDLTVVRIPAVGVHSSSLEYDDEV